MEAKITFSNGNELNVEVNGSAYITASKPDFPADLSNVRVTSSEGETTFENAEVIECASVDNRYWFALREVPADKAEKQAIEAKFAEIEDALCDLSKE